MGVGRTTDPPGAIDAGDRVSAERFDEAYLRAKASIDDRSLHEATAHAFGESLVALGASAPLRNNRTNRKPHLLEIGAGSGATLERLVRRWDLHNGEYHALDHDDALLAALTASPGAILARERGVVVTTHTESLEAFVERSIDEHPDAERFDVLLAHLVWDLFDVPTVMPRALGLLEPGGIAYFTCLFDGVTSFLPTLDPELDERIARAYHASMTASDPHRSGPNTGRAAIETLISCGAEILSAGPSGWAIVPIEGTYPEGAPTVLATMLDFVEDSVGRDPTLHPDELARWLTARRRALASQRLALLTHQWDVLARIGRSAP